MNTPSDAAQGVFNMFGRKKDQMQEGKIEMEEERREERAEATATLDVPSREPSPAAAPVVQARPARRASTPHSETVRRIGPGADSEGKCLVVGRSISLQGQIKSCEKLIVEGFVESQIDGCRELEIARSGVFKGDASVESADISGTIEGSVTAREILIVRASGRIRGKVSYGQLEVERGGMVFGEMQPCSEEEPREAAPVLAAETPVG